MSGPPLFPDRIDEEVADRPQWLMFDTSNDVPRRPHWRGDFYGISWSDPDDWHTFDEAVEAAQQKDSWGIGYVTAADNDDYARGLYGVIDIDGCADQDGNLKDWVPDLEPLLDDGGYAEWSPSRREEGKDAGLHIPFVVREVPDWWADSHFTAEEHEGVEVLTNKFVTFTGDLYSEGEIIEQDDVFDDWLAEAYEVLNDEDPRAREQERDLSTFDGSSDTPDPDDEDEDYDEWLDRELVEEALGHISPNCSYAEWRDIGFALGDFFGTETEAYSVFTSWSRKSSKWDEDAERLAEDIVSRGDEPGGVTVATLVHKAKQNGWEPPSRDEGTSLKELAAEHLDRYDSAEDVPDGFLDDLKEEAQTDGEVVAEAEAVAGGPDPRQTVAEPDGGDAGGATAASGSSTTAAATPEERSREDKVADKIFREVLLPLENPDDFEGEPIGKEKAVHRTAEILDLYYDWIRPREDTRGWRDTLYNYVADEGIYEPFGAAEAERLVERFCKDAATNDFVSQVVGKLGRMNRTRARRLDEDPNRLVVENGILDLSTGELDDHTPREYHRSRLDIEWDPDADVSAVDDFLHEVVDGRDVDRLYRFIAHALYKDYPGEKAAMLLGEGRNGKSMFLELVEEFLGEFNVTHQPLRALNEDRWATAYLNGRMANIVPDMSDQSPNSMQQFKALTGADTVSGDVKFEQPVRFTNHATLMFACNEMPVLHDDTRGNWRRWQLINFPHTFDDGDPDAKDSVPKEQLRDRLFQEEEFQGLLVRCVEEISRWAEDPEEEFFPDADHWKTTRSKMRKAAEPVYDFAQTCLRQNDESEVPKEEVRECYRRYATAEGLTKFSDEEFGRRLLNLTDFSIDSGRLRGDEGPNHRVNVYKGVELTDRAKAIMRDETAESAAQTTTDDFEAPDASTKGSTAETQRVVETLQRNADDQGTISRGALAEQLTRQFDMDLERAKDEIETALHNGSIMETGDGLRET